ncbi:MULTISPECIES: hypothetical protein [Streptosporangium]|uniref:Uncharacterized protein n=1 Tax=Streptosporangium brasiliense TaxID=47480 RepID=A0ABT9RKN0_9ACTN|nr:hypothetical protein [Streptosporangium brasiliense]MDP9869849.1 hypothetical protein [Streptosporangium brasiliense]
MASLDLLGEEGVERGYAEAANLGDLDIEQEVRLGLALLEPVLS